MMNMPGVQFLNLSDLEGMQPEAKRSRRKRETKGISGAGY